MPETRVTRSKAKLKNLKDQNGNNNSVANKNKQDDSGKIEVDSRNNRMESAPFKLKNTFNDFNNVRNISETTNYTVSVKETNQDNENSEGRKCDKVLESVNKMVTSGKTDVKVIRSFLDHVSGGDVVGLMAKLVTSTELDKIVDIVGATEVKQETFNDNTEVSDYQNNVETVAEVISDDETNHTSETNIIELNPDNSKSGKDLAVISEVVGSHVEYHSDDEVEITQVIRDGGSGTNSSSRPSTSMPSSIHASNPSSQPSMSMPSSTSASNPSSHPTSSSHEVAGLIQACESEYQQLIQRYLAPVSLGSSVDTAQMEAQMLQFFQQNGCNGGNQLSDMAQLEAGMVQFLQQSGYAGYQEFLARSDLSTLAALLPSTSSSSSMSVLPSSSSSMATRSSSRQSSLSRHVPNLPKATLTPMGVSLTPVSSTSPVQPPPAHRRLEPAHITPTGVSLTKVPTKSTAKGSSQDVSGRQLYADPRSDLPPAGRNDCAAARPPVIVSVESMSRSASVVANSLAKSSARRASVESRSSRTSVESLSRSSNVVAHSLAKSSARRTKTGGAVLSKVSQKESKRSKDGGKGSNRGEAASPVRSEDDFIGEDLDTERINRNDKKRVKRTKHKILNNVIEDSESESSVQSISDDSEDDDYVYEEAENENVARKRNPRAGSSKKRKIVEGDESSDSNENARKFLRPRFKSTSEEEESYSSDDMTPQARRSRAFKQFKLKRNSGQKSSEKAKTRISARAVDSETDEGDGEKEENAKKKVKRNLYNSPKKKKVKAKVANYIDSSDSESDRDLDGFVVDNIESESDDGSDSDEDDDFVVNDDDDEVLGVNNEFRKMMESLKRRSEKFQNLNEDYEIGSKCKQLGGYDDSDDEPAENNYPPKLLEDLREVRNEASKDKENDGLEDAEDLSNDDVIKEWEMYEVDQSENLDGECVCGQTGLRWMYFMRNKNIQNWEFYTRIVGSECINWFHKANPKSCMALLSRVAKDGCILYYRKKLDSGQLLMTVGGNMLPGFLAENQEEHKEEYKLPISVTKLKCGKDRVDIKVKPPPASQGKGLEKVRDTGGKILVVDQRYHVYLKPSIKPSKPPKCKKHWRGPAKCRCNLKKDPAKVEFIILKIENLKDKEEKASRKPPTVKSFIK